VSHAWESRAPSGGEWEWSQPGTRPQLRSCSKPGSRLRRAGVIVESSVSASVRRFGMRAQGKKRWSERREPEVREWGDLAGADDNKLVAEIGERHLAAGSTVEPRSASSDGWRAKLGGAWLVGPGGPSSVTSWVYRGERRGCPDKLEFLRQVFLRAVTFSRKIEIEPIKGVLVSEHHVS
jgi:hypothetical protein